MSDLIGMICIHKKVDESAWEWDFCQAGPIKQSLGPSLDTLTFVVESCGHASDEADGHPGLADIKFLL